ncbi:MAG: nucleotidyl transferase AbiEii/AbiGii toxin family protein [Armatimonadetes bacterium]|nr:nucleotidyl transferase AbiEii/AbiGii toxin family protein [Armatimonadota bacterium]
MKPDGFPGSLNGLQRDLLQRFGHSHPGKFFLTGGAALVGYYGHERETRDLDLFTRDPEAFEWVPQLLADAVQEVGGEAISARAYPTFRRYRVLRGQEETIVDLVLETVPPVYPPVLPRGEAVAVDTPEEIAINKVCAVVGRGEPRDLQDLFFLHSRGIDLTDSVRLASVKDGGIGPDTLLMVLPAVPATGSVAEFRDRWVRQLRMDLLPPATE